MAATKLNPCIFCKINENCQQYYHNGTTNSQHIESIKQDTLTGGTIVLAETDSVTVFRPKEPVANSHLLIVSKQHIANLDSVTYNHIELIEHMISVGYYCMLYEDKLTHGIALNPISVVTNINAPLQINDKQLTKYNDIHYDVYARGWVPQNGLRFVFHRPPFNSVNHLHLHVQRLPYLYYSSIAMYAPGTLWCIDASDVLTDLRRKKTIAVKQGTYKPDEAVRSVAEPASSATTVDMSTLESRSNVMD